MTKLGPTQGCMPHATAATLAAMKTTDQLREELERLTILADIEEAKERRALAKLNTLKYNEEARNIRAVRREAKAGKSTEKKAAAFEDVPFPMFDEAEPTPPADPPVEYPPFPDPEESEPVVDDLAMHGDVIDVPAPEENETPRQNPQGGERPRNGGWSPEGSTMKLLRRFSDQINGLFEQRHTVSWKELRQAIDPRGNFTDKGLQGYLVTLCSIKVFSPIDSKTGSRVRVDTWASHRPSNYTYRKGA